MKKIILSLSFLIFVSCVKNGETFNLVMTKQTHTINLNVDQSKDVFEISSPLMKGDSMNLTRHPNDAKIFYGNKDNSNNLWTFNDGRKETIKEVIVAPYYGMFSYNLLQRFQDPRMQLLNPQCSFTTKYLLIAAFTDGNAVIGCIEPRNNQED